MSRTMINRVPLDPTALHEGYLAGRRGVAREDNPYQVGTREALAWDIGRINGSRKRLWIVHKPGGSAACR